MLNGIGMLLFVVFGVELLVMYMAIRRGVGAPGVIAGVGMVASIVTMLLIALSQGNNALQSVVVALFVGGLFSGLTLAVAWYFHTHDRRAATAHTVEASDT